jgi:hypothetical protein
VGRANNYVILLVLAELNSTKMGKNYDIAEEKIPLLIRGGGLLIIIF